MTNNSTKNIASNLLSDIDFAVEWADRSGVLRRLAKAHPLLQINRMTARQSLLRAVGYYVQAGGNLKSIWSLDDILTPEAFEQILKCALLKSAGTAHCMAQVMMITAREWARINLEQMAALQGIASRLPPACYPSRHNRSAWMSSRGNCCPVPGRPHGLKKSA